MIMPIISKNSETITLINKNGAEISVRRDYVGAVARSNDGRVILFTPGGRIFCNVVEDVTVAELERELLRDDVSDTDGVSPFD